jgi:hypothetical protein
MRLPVEETKKQEQFYNMVTLYLNILSRYHSTVTFNNHITKAKGRHVVCTGHNTSAARNVMEKYYKEDLGKDGRILLKCISKKYVIL